MSNETTQKNPTDLDPKHDAGHADDVIVTPKGSSKVRFLMTFLLVILVLTTFQVSGPMLDVFSGKSSGLKSYMSWKGADGTTQSISGQEFGDAKRALAPILAFAFPGGQTREATDEQTATFILMDRAALDSGVRVTDSEVKAWIETTFQTLPNYEGWLARYRLNQREFGSTLRRMLRFNRYRDLTAAALAVPDPAAIEKMWKSAHQEYQFDYIELPVATLLAEAKSLAPKGDELKTWFDALLEPEKQKYKLKPRVSAELVALSLEGDFVADKLLAKYPRPADENAETVAKAYHEGFGYMRWPAVLDPTKPPQMQQLMKPWEECQVAAMKEAPVYHALTDWEKDMRGRAEKGETIDLALEASALGLTYRKQADAQNQEGWKALGISFVGRRTIEVLFGEKVAGTLFAAIQVDEKAFVFGRTVTIEVERMPDFAEIEAQVTQAWADKRAKDLALEKLEKVRDAFGTRPDPTDTTAPPFQPEADLEKFTAACNNLGFSVKHRDWRERVSKAVPDETPGETYIRSASNLYTLKEGTIPKPALDVTGGVAFLTRAGGLRDPDPAKMQLKDLDNYTRQQSMQDRMMFTRLQLQTKEFLQQRYGLDIQSWHPQPENAN